MSAFSPDLLKSLGAFITAAPGSENHQLDGSANADVPQGAEQEASPELQPTSAGGLAASYANKADAATQDGRAAGQAYGDAAVGQLGKAEQAGKGAINAEAGYEKQLAAAEKSTFDDQLANIHKFDDHFAQTMGEVRQKTQSAYDQYLKVTDDYKNTHVYNWWDNAATGAKIAGYISQFLAGGLQGLTGQLGAPTPLDKAIEHDLQLQRMNIAQKGEVAGQARGLYNDLKSQFKDEIVAEGAMREIAYTSTIKRLEAIAGGMSDQASKARAQKAIQELTAKVAQLKSETLVHLANVTQNGAMQQAGVYENLAGLWGSMDASEKAAKAKGEGIVSGVSGIKYAEYLSDTQKEKLSEQKTAASKLLQTTKQLQDLIQNKGSMDPTEYMNAKDQLVKEMVLAKKNTDALGAISKADMSLAEGTIGASGGFMDSIRRIALMDSDPEQVKRLAKFYISTKAGWQKKVGSYEVVNKATGQRIKLQDQEGLGE